MPIKVNPLVYSLCRELSSSIADEMEPICWRTDSELCPVFLTNLKGKVDKVGKVGKVGKIGKVGKVGRVGKVGKEGKEGRLRE